MSAQMRGTQLTAKDLALPLPVLDSTDLDGPEKRLRNLLQSAVEADCFQHLGLERLVAGVRQNQLFRLGLGFRIVSHGLSPMFFSLTVNAA